MFTMENTYIDISDIYCKHSYTHSHHDKKYIYISDIYCKHLYTHSHQDKNIYIHFRHIL